MLVNILDTYSNKTGLDFDFSAVNEMSEDYLDATDPDLDFGSVREKILSDRVLSKRVVNQTVVSVELFDTLWDNDGNKVNISVLFSKGQLGFGTRVKVLVRTIDALVNGSIKSFLSIEAYNNYLKNISVGA